MIFHSIHSFNIKNQKLQKKREQATQKENGQMSLTGISQKGKYKNAADI